MLTIKMFDGGPSLVAGDIIVSRDGRVGVFGDIGRRFGEDVYFCAEFQTGNIFAIPVGTLRADMHYVRASRLTVEKKENDLSEMLDCIEKMKSIAHKICTTTKEMTSE